VIDKLPVPQRQPVRDDVKAALDQVRVTKATAELAQQKYKPTLEVFGSAALNNEDPTSPGTAYGGSFRTNKPTTMVGVRINAPLGLDNIRKSSEGWEQTKIAADESYQRKLLEQDHDWSVLNDRFKQAQDRIHLYTDLETKQKDKFDNERQRRTAGRTTTQQVLLFENDYESAQISRIQALADFFTVYSQMKLYEEGNHELR
jgi:outer membrane protein TolC